MNSVILSQFCLPCGKADWYPISFVIKGSQ